MNIPNKSTCGGLKIFHEGNHNNEGNPHPQYVVDKVYYVPSDSDSNSKWAKILETYVNNNTCNTFTYLLQSGGVTNGIKLNALIYVNFNVDSNGEVNVKINVDNEENFSLSNIGYKVEDNKIKLYIKSNLPYTTLQLRLLHYKIESGTTYVENITYETISDVISPKSRKVGLTIDRPTGVNVGYQYFDLNIAKPIWWNGSVWTLATGVQV